MKTRLNQKEKKLHFSVRLKALAHVFNCAIQVVDDWVYGIRLKKDLHKAKLAIGTAQLRALRLAILALKK